MPGDPLRSKFIAETFLENPVLVNNVRGVQVAGEDGAGNERLGVALQVALERTRTVDRVIPCLLYTSSRRSTCSMRSSTPTAA